jgi:hypothetical protein
MKDFFSAIALLATIAFAAAAGPDQPAKPTPPGKAPEAEKPVMDLPGVAPKQPEVLKLQAPDLGQVQRWVGKPPVKSNKDLAGKVTVVFFWSSDTSSSLQNLVCFAEWQKLFKDQGLEIIAIHTCDLGQPFPVQNRDEKGKISKEDEQSLIKLNERINKLAKPNPPVRDTGVDTDGDLKQAWRVARTPTFFLIDKKGMLRYKYEGFLEYQKLHKEPVMRAKVDELLKEEVIK